jgi:hypothetical protein
MVVQAMPMNATELVIEALFKEVRFQVPAGESFPMEDLDTYRHHATRWLGEHSELYTSDTDEADWQEIYETFKA